MEDFDWLIIGIIVIGILGSIIRWLLAIRTLTKVSPVPQQNLFYSPDALVLNLQQLLQLSLGAQNLDRLLPNLDQMLKQFGQLSPQQQAQFRPQLQGLVARADTQFHNLDSLHRQQHEVFMGRLHGMAAEVGLPFNPGSY